MSEHKCVACGQFSGKGHRCPTPVVIAVTRHVDMNDPSTESAPYNPLIAVNVDDRVARAQAALAARPAPTGNYDVTSGLNEARGTDLLSNKNATTISNMVNGQPVSEPDAVTAAVEFQNAMIELARDNAEAMRNGSGEYIADEQADLISRLQAVQALTDHMTDSALLKATQRINEWTPDTAERMLNSTTVNRRHLLFKHAEVPFEAERHYYDMPNTTDDTYSRD